MNPNPNSPKNPDQDTQPTMVIHASKKLFRYALLWVVSAALILWAVAQHRTLLEWAGWLFGLIGPFVAGLCIAFVLNAVLTPLEKLWVRLFKQKRLARALKRPVCLILTTLIVLGAVCAVVFMLLPQIRHTVDSLVNNFPEYLKRVTGWWNGLADALKAWNVSLPELKVDFKAAGEWLYGILQQNTQNVIDTTVTITATVFSSIFNGVLAIAFSFYILAQKERLARQAKSLTQAVLPENGARTVTELAQLTYLSFYRFVTGQMTEAVIIGVLCFIGMLIFQMPYAAVISVLVGFTALIPIFGAFFGTAVGAMLILMTNPLQAVWFVIFIIVLQQLEGNLIYPKVVGRSVGLPGIWVLLAVTVGGNAMGIGGMVLAVPLSSVVYTLAKRFVRSRRKKA